MLSWSERSSRLWPSLELRLSFSFFAPVVQRTTSASAGLTRVRSGTDCVVSLDVVSWLGAAAVAVVTVSGSSGGLNCTL